MNSLFLVGIIQTNEIQLFKQAHALQKGFGDPDINDIACLDIFTCREPFRCSGLGFKHTVYMQLKLKTI